jgi:hypothetical protein
MNRRGRLLLLVQVRASKEIKATVRLGSGCKAIGNPAAASVDNTRFASKETLRIASLADTYCGYRG